MSRGRLLAAGGVLLVLSFVTAWAAMALRREPSAPKQPPAEFTPGQTVKLPGGWFRMGSDVAVAEDERPAHDVCVDPLEIDQHEVTNRQFAAFVSATGYVTTAERRGWSYVYDGGKGRWEKTAGADWRHPGGPETSLVARDDYPVVQVSWYDASAYARWAGRRLPSEAEWEYAARGGLRDADFPWGRQQRPAGRFMANYRQFDPAEGTDGYPQAASVGSFPPSRFGLVDMSGNVGEWCADWYAADYYGGSRQRNPTGPADGTCRVIRGGSWLSPEGFRVGHRVGARDKRAPDESCQHLGFRCAGSAP